MPALLGSGEDSLLYYRLCTSHYNLTWYKESERVLWGPHSKTLILFMRASSSGCNYNGISVSTHAFWRDTNM